MCFYLFYAWCQRYVGLMNLLGYSVGRLVDAILIEVIDRKLLKWPKCRKSKYLSNSRISWFMWRLIEMNVQSMWSQKKTRYKLGSLLSKKWPLNHKYVTIKMPLGVHYIRIFMCAPWHFSQVFHLKCDFLTIDIVWSLRGFKQSIDSSNEHQINWV